MHFWCRVYLLLVYIQRIPDIARSPSNDYPREPRHLSELVWDSRIGRAAVPGAPELITTPPMVHVNYSSKTQVTPKAGKNALLGPKSLLKLTLLNLHSASSHTLLEAPSHRNTLCWSGIEAPQFPLVHLSRDCRSYIEFRAPYPPSAVAVLLRMESTPNSPSVLLCLDWVPLCLDCCSFISFLTPEPSPPFQHSSTSLDSPQSPLALHSIELALFLFLLRSCNTFGALLFCSRHIPSCAPYFPSRWSPFSSDCIILPVKPQLWFAPRQHLLTPLLDIKNRDKRHWKSLSATHYVRIVSKYMESLQLLRTVDEIFVSALVRADDMGEVVDDIDTMFEWYRWTVWSGYCFHVPAFMFESLVVFFGTIL